jgi:hypothetical protein
MFYSAAATTRIPKSFIKGTVVTETFKILFHWATYKIK